MEEGFASMIVHVMELVAVEAVADLVGRNVLPEAAVRQVAVIRELFVLARPIMTVAGTLPAPAQRDRIAVVRELFVPARPIPIPTAAAPAPARRIAR